MTNQTRTVLKTYFNAGDQPTEAQFADLIDSAINVADTNPGVGTDGYALVWDNDTAQFALRAPFDGTPYTLLSGRAGGQALYGGTGANDDLTLQGTAHGTKATSYVFIQPAGGDVVIGAYSPSVDSAFNIQRNNRTECVLIGGDLVGTALFSHAVADQTEFDSAGSSGYASYDSVANVKGTGSYNHFYSFQARPQYNGTGAGVMGTMSCFVAYPTISGPTTTYHGIHIFDSLGAGVITNNYGILIDDLVRGSVNWAIFSNGAAPSYFGGSVIADGGLKTSGSINDEFHGVNFSTSNGNKDLFIGTNTHGTTWQGFSTYIGQSIGRGTGGYNTFIGAYVFQGATTAGTNTAIGSHTGYNNNGSGNVFIGNHAGYYETGSDKLIIDNAQRASEADARAKALIYGVFDAAVANQALTFNGGKMGFFGHTAAVQPAKASYNNWAALGDVVAALVSIGIFDTA